MIPSRYLGRRKKKERDGQLKREKERKRRRVFLENSHLVDFLQRESFGLGYHEVDPSDTEGEDSSEDEKDERTDLGGDLRREEQKGRVESATN